MYSRPILLGVLDWCDALQKRNYTFNFYTIPVSNPSLLLQFYSTRIVDTKWVYVIRRRLGGSIDIYKARKVGRGFTQEDGINYDSDMTYAQMMRPETLNILLALAMHKE